MTLSNLQLQTAKTPRATSGVLRSARPAMQERHHTQIAKNPLPNFCEGLSVGENIIVWVSNEAKEDNPGEEYFVTKIKEKAVKLEEAGTYIAIPFKKNDYIVSVQWYEFVSIVNNRKNNRFCKKGFVQ